LEFVGEFVGEFVFQLLYISLLPLLFALGICIPLRPEFRSCSASRETVPEMDGNWKEPQHLTKLYVTWPILENPQ